MEKKHPTHTIETVTPEQAREWLESNVGTNRNLIQARVTQYSNDMSNDDWYVCQPLIFVEDGTLIDGQNRLNAVIKTGIPTEFLILRGVDKRAFHAIDTGKPRSTADIAKIMGTGLGQDHLSCYNYMYYAPGSHTRQLSNFSKKQTVEKMEALRDALIFACQGHTNALKGQIKHSAINAVVARAYFYEDQERLYEFLVAFRTGFSNGDRDSAAIALRNLYITTRSNERNSIKSSSTRRGELYLLAQSALSHFLKGNPLKVLRLPKTPKNLWYVEDIDGPKKK